MRSFNIIKIGVKSKDEVETLLKAYMELSRKYAMDQCNRLHLHPGNAGLVFKIEEVL